ncbi:hypothetical protein CR205_16775 [Alteribacter lacisalsi]|uniref:VanZ-like domain-containing protein n=1 Tax=Alteribacter lacisalsi TaxID=2045244 RepID=A0A2W0HFB8_9BACI|nr:VanZ family protein [Alteribacter lacisalsi]PYZ96025.1 hypothetical protein CR205_16775 [Alteribacter lacisalsi]
MSNWHKNYPNHLLSHYVPFLAWIGMIQYASSMPAGDQSLDSPLSALNLNWVENMFGWVSFYYGTSVVSLETRTTEQFVEFFLRKGAHVLVYLVLAILAYRVARLWIRRIPEAAVAAIAFITAYAAYDEVRHHFHPGRSGMVEDVLLDMAGGAIGILIWVLIERRNKWKRNP